MMVVAKARSWPAIENNDGPATPVAGTALAGEADAADALAVIVNVVVAHANQTQEQHGGSTSRAHLAEGDLLRIGQHTSLYRRTMCFGTTILDLVLELGSLGTMAPHPDSQGTLQGPTRPQFEMTGAVPAQG